MTRLLAASTVFLALGLAAQEKVKVRLSARQGDSVTLRMTRIREDANHPDRNGRSVTPVELRILEASPTGFVLSWKYGKTTIGRQLSGPEAAMLEASSELLGSFTLEAVLDRDGAFQRIRNEAAVSKTMASMTGGIIQLLLKDEPSEVKRNNTAAMLRQTLSPAVQLQLASRDLQNYFGWFGAELAPGGAVAEFPYEFPFPLGGGKVPAKIRVRMPESDAKRAIITTVTEYDTAALADLTRQFFAKAMPQASQQQLERLPSLSMADEGRYEFDHAAGWFRHVVITRRMSLADKMRRSDGWEFHLE